MFAEDGAYYRARVDSINLARDMVQVGGGGGGGGGIGEWRRRVEVEEC